MADREFLLRIVGDISSVQKSMGNMEKDVSGFKSTAKKIGVAVGGAFAVDQAVDFGKALVSAAGDQQQAIGATQSVFKDYASTVNDASKGAAKSLGLSRAEFLQLSDVTGALMKSAGVPLNEVTDSTLALTERAADLSAMFGGPVSDSMGAINSALKGEFDPLEKFGISLKQSQIDAKAQGMGLVDASGKVTEYGRKMAAVQLIMEQSADAAGTFKKEQGTVEGQTQRLSAQFTDLQATLGQKLLPVVVQVASILRGLIEFVSANQDWLVPVIAGVVALVAALKIWTIAQAALNVVLTANPIGLIVVAIVGLIAAVVALYLKVDWFRDFVDKSIDLVVAAFQWLWDFIKGLAQLWWTLFSTVYIKPLMLLWDYVQWLRTNIPLAFSMVVSGIQAALSFLWDVITWPFRLAIDFVTGYLSTLQQAFSRVYGWIHQAFSGIDDVITWPFRVAFNAIRALWNSTIGGFGFTLPSWIPGGIGGQGFRIPMMAAGGIVTGPTLAMLGESGREAVIPLTGPNAGGIGNVTINVYALTANAEVGRRVYDALREYERTAGKLPVVA